MNRQGRPPQFDPLNHINSSKQQNSTNKLNKIASTSINNSYASSKANEVPVIGSSKYSPYQGTQHNMFSPQNTPDSPFNATSPPTKKLRNDFYIPGEKLNSIGQNTSFARGYSSASLKSLKLTQPQIPQQSPESDEDERFLRLAREALVATASGVSSTLVDPTIQDLLTRLQYASSPHGNPIKRSESIHANQNGQLMIQGFYQQFPNLSNDIFTGGSNENTLEEPKTTPNHPSTYNEGWNFLIGEPMVLKGPQYNKEPEEIRQVLKQELIDDEDDEELSSDDADTAKLSSSARKNSGTDDPLRKFLCSKCSMSFRRSSDLKRHEKQHLTIPPNICELCGKGFARKDALKRHVGTLTCKRNAERKLYAENLNYLPKVPFDPSTNTRPDKNW